MSTQGIVLIVVIAVVLVLVALGALWANRNRKSRLESRAESMRAEVAADREATITESRSQAQESDEHAEQARLAAARAEEEAAEARRRVEMEEAEHEDRLREADRLDPNVDHRAEDYRPTTETPPSSEDPDLPPERR